MMRKTGTFLISILLLLGIASFQGCIYLVIGSIGAVGGYVVSPDTVEGTIERDFEEVWQATSDVPWITTRVALGAYAA